MPNTPRHSCIYGLYDVQGNLRYVGKTYLEYAAKRLSSHIARAKRGANEYSSRWIRSLLRQEMAPHMKIFEICEPSLVDHRERDYISFCFKGGSRLTNTSEGGGGGSGCNPSPEARMKMSLVHKGNKYNLGRKLSSGHKSKISKSLLGNKRTLGYHHSEEARTKMSRSHAGKKLTADRIKKLSASKIGNKNWFGKHHSQETIRKMSISHSLRWKRRKEAAE